MEHLSDAEIARIEDVEAELNWFVERRAAAKKEANAEEAAWAESERKFADNQRRQNCQAWAHYRMNLARNFRVLADENESAARRHLQEARGGI